MVFDPRESRWDGRFPGVATCGLALVVTVAAACGDGGTTTPGPDPDPPNRPPVATGSIPPQTVTAGQTITIDVSGYFDDPDGDALTYTAETSDANVVTASAAGSSVVVAGLARGTAMVTVTARDPGGLAAQQSFPVTVPNRSPIGVGTIPDQELKPGDTVTGDVSAYFNDPDGDTLSYEATSSDEGVATATISGNSLTIAAVSEAPRRSRLRRATRTARRSSRVLRSTSRPRVCPWRRSRPFRRRHPRVGWPCWKLWSVRRRNRRSW